MLSQGAYRGGGHRAEGYRPDGWVTPWRMPWKETYHVKERKRFIEDWLRGGASNVAALWWLYGVSRKTGYKWPDRFEAGGWPGLEDRSQAAHRRPRRIPEAVEWRLIEARRRHPSWGPEEATGLARSARAGDGLCRCAIAPAARARETARSSPSRASA